MFYFDSVFLFSIIQLFAQLGIHFISAKSGLHKTHAHRMSSDTILTNYSLQAQSWRSQVVMNK